MQDPINFVDYSGEEGTLPPEFIIDLYMRLKFRDYPRRDENEPKKPDLQNENGLNPSCSPANKKKIKQRTA